MEQCEKYQRLAESWLIEKNLDRYLDVFVTHEENFKVKEDGLLGKVKKATKPWSEFNQVPDFIIFIDEDQLDQLEIEYGIEYRDLAFESIMHPLTYDADGDRPNLLKPDIVTFDGIMKKFGYDQYVAVREAIRQIQEKNQDEG